MIQIPLLVGIMGCTVQTRSNTIWESINRDELEYDLSGSDLYLPREYYVYQFKLDQIDAVLSKAGDDHDSGVFLELPCPKSGKNFYKVWKAKDSYSELKAPTKTSYIGYCVSEFSTRILIDVLPQGFQALIITSHERWRIYPIDFEREFYVIHRENVNHLSPAVGF